jgi:hypothetical protein
MDNFRTLMKSRAGKIACIVISVVFLTISVAQIIAFCRSSTPDAAFYTTYVCTETGKSFRHKNQMGETLPILSPYSGKNTGIPGEACYWTADGGTKSDPTWVLLNESIGKPGPTFCPDCGRLVVGHNPRPGPDVSPPPTQQEYSSSRGH